MGILSVTDRSKSARLLRVVSNIAAPKWLPGSKIVGLSLTHPYRFEQFVYMLRENGVLDRV
jgi:hypothetical protein